MKFTAVLALVAAATVVSASTNAERLARGLPPNAPGKRASPALRARHGYPSNAPHCNTGPVKCCNDHGRVGSHKKIDDLLDGLPLHLPIGTEAWINCSPLTVIGVGSNQCSSQTVCCKDNHFNGLINVDCNNINL